MVQIIDGRKKALVLKQLVAKQVADFKSQHDFTPKLVALCVGEDPASQIYLAAKSKQAREVGMDAEVLKQPADVSTQKLEAIIQQLNQDPAVSGILLQLPLPEAFEPTHFINLLDPLKDVDGLTFINAGALANGQPQLVPCTPLGCILLLRDLLKDLTGKHAVIIGRSPLVGKPIAQMLLAENCTVTLAHSKTLHLAEVCKQADIVVAAAGRAHLVKRDWIKPDAIVLDVGINRLSDGTLTGDVDFEAVKSIAGAITPVPGGVGPMTVACLLLNTVLAAAVQKNLSLSVLPSHPLKDHWCPF